MGRGATMRENTEWDKTKPKKRKHCRLNWQVIYQNANYQSNCLRKDAERMFWGDLEEDYNAEVKSMKDNRLKKKLVDNIFQSEYYRGNVPCP